MDRDRDSRPRRLPAVPEEPLGETRLGQPTVSEHRAWCGKDRFSTLFKAQLFVARPTSGLLKTCPDRLDKRWSLARIILPGPKRSDAPTHGTRGTHPWKGRMPFHSKGDGPKGRRNLS